MADTAGGTLIVFLGTLEYGGHEVMTAVILERILDETDIEVHVLASARNHRLAERLDALGRSHVRLTVRLIDAAFPKFQAALWPLHPRLVRRLVRAVKDLPAGPLLVAAGGIEQAALGVVAGRLAGRRVSVYVPFGHSVRQTGGRFALLRDLSALPYFRLPHRVITINHSEAENLRRHGTPAARIALYPNLLPPPSAATALDAVPAALADALAAIGPGRRRIAAIGRVHFRQKSQDWLVRLWAEQSAALGDAVLLIIGDGPDRPALESQIAAHGLAGHVVLLPWLALSPAVYRAFDLVCLASRIEATPLVMVEAVLAGTPVVAARVGGIPELLPEDWTFAWGDAARATHCLTTVDRASAATALERTRAAFETIFLRRGAGAEFARLVAAALPDA